MTCLHCKLLFGKAPCLRGAAPKSAMSEPFLKYQLSETHNPHVLMMLLFKIAWTHFSDVHKSKEYSVIVSIGSG